MKYRLLLLPLALAACSQTPQASGPAASATATTATTAMSAAGAAAAPAADIRLLGAYHWQLTNATDSTGQRIDALFVRPDKPIQLDFSAGRLSVSNSCNNLGGGYNINNGRLQMSPMVSTMMACFDPALAALDDAITQRLQGSPRLNLQADANTPHLQLITERRDTLSFTGLPTPETRYGGPGQTVFMEVAAHTVPCHHPLMPGKQCLQVRERHFDKNGLPAGTPGAWHPLYQDIDGYTHEPGIRNVIRVKRFAIRNAPADAPSVAYVLDLVVESHQVSQ